MKLAPGNFPTCPARFARYRIDQQLSQTEQAVVYLAHDTQLDRPVVLKVFAGLAAEGREAVQHFAREVRLAATVVHPNLCPVYEAGQNEGVFYATTAHVPGKRLAEYVKGKPLPQRQVAGVVRKVAQALQEAHQSGLVHGALGPSNIIISPSKDPVVINLGLTGPFRAADVVQGRGPAGTALAYLSPEQAGANDAAVGPASDVYSLGAILYELLTGQPPYLGTPQGVLGQLRSRAPLPPSSLRPDLDPALEAVCLRAMARRPENRFPGMTAFAAALSDYLKKSDNEAVQAAPPAPYPAPVAVIPVEAYPAPVMVEPDDFPPAGPPVVLDVQVMPAARADYPAPRRPRVPVRFAEQDASRGTPVWPWVAGVTALLGLLVGTMLLLFLGKGGGDKQAEDAQVAGVQKSDQKLAGAEPEKVDPDFASDEQVPLDAKVPLLRLEQKVQVDPLGNSEFKAEIKLPKDRHAAFKKMMSSPVIEGGKVVGWRPPKMDNVLRYLEIESSGSVMEKPDGAFGEEALQAQGRERGWAKHREGHWSSELTTDPRMQFHMVKKHGTVVTVRAFQKLPGLHTLAEMEITLPRGAHNIQVETQPNRLVYDAPTPPAGGQAGGRPALRLQTKPHIMSALYKLYGDRKFDHLWVARSVFRNRGTETLSDYRVRFRIGGYSPWSRWERSDTVYPGQTVVDAFHPVIDVKVRDLRGATPADVEIEYQYQRPGGQTVTDSHSERIKILGINEGVFTDLPVGDDSTFFERFKDAPLVLATFTSANDPVMHDVVGMLHKLNGGKGASASDEGALLFMRALYDLFRVNIAYEGAKGDVVEGVLHQHLKYGREVLRTKSGTCVNLAILYASVCEAAGLDAYIILVPGHAFPGVRLPQSKQVYFVETTGCVGGTPDKSIPFEKVVPYAMENYRKWSAVGLITEVDIHRQRQRGVTPPELPDPGQNPLAEWNIKAPAYQRTVVMKPPADNPTANRPEQLANSPILGVWTVAVNGKQSLGYFHGNGKFAIGADLNKPTLEGQYSYTGTTLVLAFSNGKRETVNLVWTANGNGFSFMEGAARVDCRRKPIGVTMRVLNIEHSALQDGRKGMKIHLHAQIDHAPGLACDVIAGFTNSRGQFLKAKNQANRDAKGFLMAQVHCLPLFPFSIYKDLMVFVPYEAMPLVSGRNDLRLVINVWCGRDKKFVMTAPLLHNFVILWR
jgi:hypothetical protein